MSPSASIAAVTQHGVAVGHIGDGANGREARVVFTERAGPGILCRDVKRREQLFRAPCDGSPAPPTLSLRKGGAARLSELQ
jgi:hypothetical protein